MRRLFHLINNELKILRLSVVVAISLTFFTASLFSVLNVYFNLSTNIFENLDKSGESLSFSAENTSLSKQVISNKKGLFSGQKDYVTRNAVLKSAQNKEFHTNQKTETDGTVHLYLYSGVAYIATDKFLQTYEQYNEFIEGEFPSQVDEICLSNQISNELDVTIGDTIFIGEDDYIISAIYDKTLLQGLSEYYICVDDTFVFDSVNIELETSAETYRLYNKWIAKGIDVEWAMFAEDYIDGISTTFYFLLAISLAIFIANIMIIYAMFSMIIINRKKHICRMITLGASNTTIFNMFYLLLVGILTVVNVVAYGLSNLFGEEIVNTCSSMFKMEFSVTKHPLVLLIYTVINMILLVLMYLLQIRNMGPQAVLDSVKGE